MPITYASSVLFVRDLKKMTHFYTEILEQEIEADFGTCIGLKCGLSLWVLDKTYPLCQIIGHTFHNEGNKNLELCFETEDFEKSYKKLQTTDIKYIHLKHTERWGQFTIRFYDPEGNIVELGESIPTFVKRLYNKGESLVRVTEITGVPLEQVTQICIEEKA